MSLPGLKSFQSVLQPGTLYEVWANPNRAVGAVNQSSGSQLRPTIEIIGDACDVYGSQRYSAEDHDGMSIIMTALEGIAAFDFIPSFIYVDGAPDSIVVSGVGAAAMMRISAKNQIVLDVDANLVLIPPQEIAAQNQVIVNSQASLLVLVAAAAQNQIIVDTQANLTLA